LPPAPSPRAGTSQIQINPAGSIRLEAGTNIDHRVGPEQSSPGSIAQYATVRILATTTPAQARSF